MVVKSSGIALALLAAVCATASAGPASDERPQARYGPAVKRGACS